MMNKEIDECLSAMIDGELDASHHSRLTDELIDNANVRSTWQRYHLVRDTLKKNLPDEIAPGLFDRVCNAIAQEPAHNIKIKSETERKPWFGFQPAYGLVAAAALVVAVVTVTQIEQTTTDMPTLAQSDTSSVIPFDGRLETADVSVVATVSMSESELSAYLANHAVRSRSYPMHDGLLPYVRSVEFQGGR
ncbi:MAG: sigma-E factor negative regulatory protein [Gammaproteobacteria bacterium]|nr:sigma-E factor negative regulatory protein [Gammaproteobacteria bacterium]